MNTIYVHHAITALCATGLAAISGLQYAMTATRYALIVIKRTHANTVVIAYHVAFVIAFRISSSATPSFLGCWVVGRISTTQLNIITPDYIPYYIPRTHVDSRTLRQANYSI